jgi:hypothetical protein
MHRATLLHFLRRQRLAVATTVDAGGAPQAALMRVAVTDQLDLVFETSDHTRKIANLQRDPRVACVIGGWNDGGERSVQYEGVADFPTGDDYAHLVAAYAAAFPAAAERPRLPRHVLGRVRPRWLRYSDYGVSPTDVREFIFDAYQARIPQESE